MDSRRMLCFDVKLLTKTRITYAAWHRQKKSLSGNGNAWRYGSVFDLGSWSDNIFGFSFETFSIPIIRRILHKNRQKGRVWGGLRGERQAEVAAWILTKVEKFPNLMKHFNCNAPPADSHWWGWVSEWLVHQSAQKIYQESNGGRLWGWWWVVFLGSMISL